LPLVIIGKGKAYKKILLEYATKNGLLKQLVFASDISDPTPLELSSIYQLASVFVFPSFYEGFGIPILEARFSGTPVIASNSSCLEETGGSHSLYFDPTDSAVLAQMISTILVDENKFIKGDIDSFRVDKSLENMINAYNKVLNCQ